MSFKDEDLLKLTKLTSQQIEHVTCAACCKYYIAPETASCGHTLCHTCWRGRQKCAYCAKPVERHSLKLNKPLQNLTENVQTLGDAFEKLFNIKVTEILMEAESENDSTKNVRDWLASSQNHFSAPGESSERSSHEMALPSPLNVSSNKIQIHTNTSKAKCPEKVVYVPTIPQDDWDKIERIPDTEDVRKDKENVVGPMDIEPFYFDNNNEYTVSNPRRSSRKRELKPDEKSKTNENKSTENQNSKDSSEEIDKKSNNSKQHWMNVKRMRKEFSKLNKKNRGKLNVSIEMCKKTQNTTKTLDVLPQAATFQYDIDENTPDNLQIKEISNDNILNSENENQKSTSLLHSNMNIITNNGKQSTTSRNNQRQVHEQNSSKTKNDETQKTNVETVNSSQKKVTDAHVNPCKMPFYKKGSLRPVCVPNEKADETSRNIKTTHNVVLDSNVGLNDDIEITIKVANTIANIVIRRKNEMEFKINTDREIQTSLDQHDVKEKTNSSNKNKDQNIVINVAENHSVQVCNQAIANPRIEELKKVSVSDKIGSGKKTDSAETTSAQFEITESVEKELSTVMDFEDVDKQIKSISIPTVGKEKSLKKKSQKSAQPSDLEYLNDLDIFDSESVKESDVRFLKDTEHAPSEILLCTVRTKNKTQKVADKRHKSTSDEDTLPKSKKPKLNQDTTESKQNQPLSNESMCYDAVMGTAFAIIDADLEEIGQSQNIRNAYILNDNNKELQQEKCMITPEEKKDTQAAAVPKTLEIINSQTNNQKDSENVFSIGIEKENEQVETAPSASTNKKLPLNVPPSNAEDFLTPVMSQAAHNDVEMIDDDSDKSVVEETPQKTSFTKMKQKSNEVHKEDNQSQMIVASNRVLAKKNSANKTSIINLTDSSEIKTDANVTAIKTVDKVSIETPPTINKFVGHVQHNSTPFARKSLNFDSEVVDDMTQCTRINDAVANTTQEREFMIKAFEKTPTAPAVKPQSLRSLALKHKKFVIAGSCLTNVEIANLRKLCARYRWSYIDKYTKDLTHLVVGVDEENRAQRSVKYMCALASSIWIVSYEWVKKSLQSKDPVNEEPYEVLDSTGHSGPTTSRLASKKLFQGISFFCLEPFSILDVVHLKSMIESAGGTVVGDAKEVRVTDETTAPAILLAEPENTQEDRFIYLAMQLSIVPVNYEWVLNCLGSYSLASIQDLLLCPAALLPKAIQKWPQELLARDEDDE